MFVLAITLSRRILSLITFPGAIIHAITYRFLCKKYHIRTSAIHYAKPLLIENKLTACESLLISKPPISIVIGPFLINVLVCIIFTFPAGCIQYLDVSTIGFFSPLLGLAYSIMTWIGYSAGIHAIPYTKDIQPFKKLHRAFSFYPAAFAYPVTIIMALANTLFIGGIIRFCFTSLLIPIIPYLLLH